MLAPTSSVLPRPSIRRGLVSMSIKMSWTICLARGSEDTTFCIVPQRFFSTALDRSVMPFVLASNHRSTCWGEVRCWSILRAS